MFYAEKQWLIMDTGKTPTSELALNELYRQKEEFLWIKK